MRSNDVTTMTVVYHRQEGKYAPAHRAVVLSTALWTSAYADGRTGRSSSPRSGYRQVSNPKAGSAEHRGWLCLDTFAGSPLTDDELCALAGPALEAIEAGGLPDLPAHVSVTLVPARDIVQTWAERTAQEARDTRERAAARLAAEERAAADRAARQRIAAVVGEQAVGIFGLQLVKAGGWQALEALLGAYHRAQLAAGVQVSTDPPSLLDAAEAIEARALNAGRIIRTDGQQPLCGSPDHDDRWCTDCDRMESGMFHAASMLRTLAAQPTAV